MCKFASMMRFARLISILFLSIYSYSQLQSLIVIGDYVIDYQSYKYEKCENKDRPELKCNGTCQLAKLLASPVKTAPELGTVLLFQTQVYLSPRVEIQLPMMDNNKSYFSCQTFNLKSGVSKNYLPPPKIEIEARLI
tara:strand:- start:1000 stop:1410 length:411 start_codon:yes stop_codon:yes gene_type:complete